MRPPSSGTKTRGVVAEQRLMDENSPFSSTLVAIKSKRKHFFFNPTYASRHSHQRLRPLLYRPSKLKERLNLSGSSFKE